jgi:hypothetical protein
MPLRRTTLGGHFKFLLQIYKHVRELNALDMVRTNDIVRGMLRYPGAVLIALGALRQVTLMAHGQLVRRGL